MNQRPRSLVRDLCETQTAECGVSRKRVIGVGFLLELIARGENRLFSPEEVRPICFCGTKKEPVRKADSLQTQVFRQRRKTIEKQKEIAAGYVTLEQTKETVVEQIANLSQVSVVPNCDEYAIEYLPLSELFDTIKGKSKYTKKYGNLHSGPYPVYSASSQGTLTHLDTYDYDGRYMTWSTMENLHPNWILLEY